MKSDIRDQIRQYIEAGNAGTSTKIAEVLGFKKPTVHTALHVMCEAGEVVKGPDIEIRDAIGRFRGYTFEWMSPPPPGPAVPMVQAAMASRGALDLWAFHA